jgi:hypothetical protein
MAAVMNQERAILSKEMAAVMNQERAILNKEMAAEKIES